MTAAISWRRAERAGNNAALLLTDVVLSTPRLA